MLTPGWPKLPGGFFDRDTHVYAVYCGKKYRSRVSLPEGLMRRPLITISAGLQIILLISCSGSNGPDTGVETPALVVQVGLVDSRPGEYVSVPVSLTLNPESANTIDSLSSLNLLIEYPYDALRLIDVKPGDGDSLWEYFTYRRDGKSSRTLKRDALRIIAYRDISNGVPAPKSQAVPVGVIAWLEFEVNPVSELIGDSVMIGFQSLDCEDNTFADGADHGLLHFMSDYETTDSLAHANDTLDCPRRFRLVSDVRYESGLVRFGGDSSNLAPLPGDLDLNGLGPNISDAVIFTNALFDDSALSGDSTIRARQLIASDVNRDGIPLQVADYEMLVRFISGDVDLFEPHATMTQSAYLNKLDWGIEISSIVELSILFAEFDLHDDTTAIRVNSFPTPGDIRVHRIGNKIKIYINWIYSPFTNNLHPLQLHLIPPPANGFDLSAIQLSTPPGVAVPVSTGNQ